MGRPRSTRWLLIGLAVAIVSGSARSAAAQDTHLIVITGVAGDDEHVAQFHTWASAIVGAAKQVGVAEGNVVYLSDKPDQDPRQIKGRSNRATVTQTFADTAARAKPNDDIFILLIGHGSFDGRQAAFNLAGPDLSAQDYAKLLEQFVRQRVVFVNTTSASGAFIQPLAGPGRIIITATKTGGERNETRFPAYFIEALQGEDADRDRNGRVSVLEAFDYARRKVGDSYDQDGNIPTEHAVLDDGSEGKLAATLFFAPRASRVAAAATADPALRALLEQRDELEGRVAALRLRKESLDPAKYELELEKLLTDLAVKTKALRDLEAKK